MYKVPEKVLANLARQLFLSHPELKKELRIYRSAVSYLIRVYAKAWEELSRITDTKKQFREAEHLVLTTKKNQARYDFDRYFPKLPSYLRCSAIQHALGSIMSRGLLEIMCDPPEQRYLVHKPVISCNNTTEENKCRS